MVTDEPLSVSTVREQLRVRCSNWARVITSAKHWRIGAWIPGAPLTSQRPPATLLRADGTVAAKAATGRAIAAPRISGPLIAAPFTTTRLLAKNEMFRIRLL